MQFRKLIEENLIAAVLALLVLVQLPFTVLYVAGRFHMTSHQRAQASRPRPRPAIKPIIPKSALEAREDPFELLPGMEDEETGVSGTSERTSPPIFRAFRETPPPGLSETPVEEPKPIAVNVQQLPPASVSPVAVAVQPMRAFKLTGVVRYKQKSMAVIQFPDKTAAHVGEGEKVPGSDCYMQTIMPTKVFVKQQGTRQRQEWLAVGEEWGA